MHVETIIHYQSVTELGVVLIIVIQISDVQKIQAGGILVQDDQLEPM